MNIKNTFFCLRKRHLTKLSILFTIKAATKIKMYCLKITVKVMTKVA